MFTRAVHPAKDKREAADSEGVELGTINSSGSIGLVEDSLGQALQFLGQPEQAGNQENTSGSNSAPSQPQTQPVSFQSLSALASQASRRWKGTHEDAAGDAPTDTANATGTSSTADADSAERAESNPDLPNTAHSTALDHSVPALSADMQQTSHSQSPGTKAQPVPPGALSSASTDAGAGVSNSRGQPLPALNLGTASSMEKKWGYPVPTGSPMFERLRSRNSSQEEEASAAPSGAPAAASSTDSEQRSAQADAGQAVPSDGHASALHVSSEVGKADHQGAMER